ncbi:MAG: sulfatase [Pirellulales bacterium]|nr:sulfatase [Pirellulales bacterium]
MTHFFPRISTAFVLATITLCLSAGPVKAEEKTQKHSVPNIVFIFVDDLGWSDLACYGHPWHETPNIDRLAKEGMRFTNGYAPAPICSASRASILTGKTVPRVGFEFVTKNEPGYQKLDSDVPLRAPPLTLNLPLAEETVAERLAALGYETAFFGKWHVSRHHKRRYLRWDPKFGPKKQGFQVAAEDFGDHPYAWGKTKPSDAPDGIVPRDSMFQRLIDFIREPHQRPFFLMASSFYVHTPVKNRCRWLVDKYAKKIPADAPNRDLRLEYAAFLETLDHHVGTILDAIDQSGLRDNTLVLFMSDNGGHPMYCANAPLRGSKWNLYEGGIRVPFMARWPGVIAPGSKSDTPIIGYDILPTFVEIAGGRADGVDGVSFAPLFKNPTWRPQRSLIWHFPYYHPEKNFSKAIDAIGVDDFAVSKTRPQSALRRGKYKVVKFAEDNRVELYDLEKDVSEQHDLSKTLPDVADEMDKLLEQQLDAMHARRAVARPR